MDYTRTVVTLACSCAMGLIGSGGNNGSHQAVFKPIKRQNDYSGGHLEVIQGIPVHMMRGFVVPMLQNIVENADPHQAFDGRSWKTMLESTRQRKPENDTGKHSVQRSSRLQGLAEPLQKGCVVKDSDGRDLWHGQCILLHQPTSLQVVL